MQILPVQIGKGLPSAKLGTVEVISRKVAIARTRKTLFMVLLLGKNGRTVLLSTRSCYLGRRSLFAFLFGKRKFVLLRSALEDFESSTLSAVPGLLGKLRYVARLHNGGGAYSHWGLEKVYGSGPAEKAIQASHGVLVSGILRTPLRDLADDLKWSAAGAQITELEFLSCLETPLGNALPPTQRLQASEKHFRSVLHSLSALVQNREPATPRDASPLPPLAQ